jgi:hypothetical protein
MRLQKEQLSLMSHQPQFTFFAKTAAYFDLGVVGSNDMIRQSIPLIASSIPDASFQ